MIVDILFKVKQEESFKPSVYKKSHVLQSDSNVALILKRGRKEETIKTYNNATLAKFFKYDYYYRIHITPRNLILGNITGVQVREVYIWNAYFTPKNLNYSAPILEVQTQFNALEEARGIVRLSGDSDVSARVILDFEGEEYTLNISASVRIVWGFPPLKDYSESLEWLTDILQSRNNEQRISVRRHPRRTFNFEHILTSEQLAKSNFMLNAWQHRDWGIPIWRERWTIERAEGATIDAPQGEWLIYQDWQKNEVIEVEDDNGKLKNPLQHVYKNAFLMPVKTARMQSTSTERINAHYSRLNANFLLTAPAERIAKQSKERFGDIDVFSYCVLNNANESHEHPIEIIDSETGVRTTISTYARTRWSGQIRVIIEDKDEAQEFIDWFYSLRGRWGEFWLPTFNNDFILKNAITPNSNAFIIQALDVVALSYSYGLCFITKDNQKHYTQIERIESHADGEQVVFSPNINTTIEPQDIKRISLMRRCRLNSDNLQISYTDREIATFNLQVINV